MTASTKSSYLKNSMKYTISSLTTESCNM